jgi:pimeloyl-ACP methyl ester carboxylesterase
VHGLGVSHRYFEPTARALERRGLPVLAPDIPGHGRSESPPRALGVAEQADWLARLLERLGVPAAAFIGNSLGCQVVAELGARDPALVRAAVLVGPTGDPAAASWPGWIARLGADQRFEPPALVALVVADYLRAGPARVLATWADAMRHPMERRLAALRAPALVVRGAHDPIAPRRWCERACRLLPDAAPVTVAGAGHVVNYSAPGPLVEAAWPVLAGG